MIVPLAHMWSGTSMASGCSPLQDCGKSTDGSEQELPCTWMPWCSLSGAASPWPGEEALGTHTNA